MRHWYRGERTFVAGSWLKKTVAMVTALAPLIGYDAAAAVAHEAVATGKTVRAMAAAQDCAYFGATRKKLWPRGA